MKFKILLSFCFASIILANAYHNRIPEGLKLDLVQVIFRHGERTCIKEEYAQFPYLNKSVYEPYGFGQLTNRGKEQMYNVGRKLRELYDGYLNKQYFSKDVYAYSSENDRTKMSLQLVLAGLFPPSKEFVWNPDLQWIPIPFRYTPKEIDILMKPYSSKMSQELAKNTRKQPEYLNAIRRYSDIFDLIKNKTGQFITYENPRTVIAVHHIFYIHEKLGLPLPNWYTAEVKEDLHEIEAIFLRSEAQTLQQKRINGGSMIKTLTENMNFDGAKANPRKIYLYSGHDFTLNGLLKGFGIEDFDNVDFGTTLILEKFRNKKNESYVRLLAYTPIDKKLIVLRFGYCSEICPKVDYLNHISNVMPNNEEMYALFNELDAHNLKELFFVDEHVEYNV